MLAGLDKSWRPDRSGVMIKVDLPEGGRPQIKMLLLAGPAPLSRKEFASAVACYFNAGADVYLQVPGPLGHYPAQALLNSHIEAAVRERVLEAVQFQMKAAYNALLKHQFEPDGLVMRASLGGQM